MELHFNAAVLEALLKNRSYKELRDALAELNEVDIAEFLETLPPEEAVLAFRTLPKGPAAEVFAELEPETQQHIVTAATDAELAAILEDLFVDDAVDFLEDMPASVVKRILKNATPETRGLINQFLHYPPDSAGSIMTAEFTDLHPAQPHPPHRRGSGNRVHLLCGGPPAQAAGGGHGAQPAAGKG